MEAITDSNNNINQNNFSNEEDNLNTVPKKLTNWANEPTVFNFKQDLTDAYSDTYTHIDKIDKWLDYLNITGNVRVKRTKNKSSIMPQLIRKQAEWRYASLTEPFLSARDIFDINPVTYEDKKAAIQNALVLNNQFNTKIDKVRFIDDYVRTVVDEGTVIVRVGWEYEEKEINKEVSDYRFDPINNPQQIQQIQQASQLSNSDPATFNQLPDNVKESVKASISNNTPIIATQIGSHIEKVIKVIKNSPTIEVVNYRNISIDPTAKGDINKTGFLSYSFESSLSALKKDGKYHNLNLINTVNNSILTVPNHTSTDQSNFNFTDKPRRKFVVFEYWGEWDIEGDGEVEPIVASWVGDVLIRLERNPFPDQKIPFVIAQYLPVRRSMYGEPDGALLKDNQEIVGAVTRGMIDTMGRSANGQMAIRKDALDLTNRRKFDKGLDYEFNAGVDPRQAFYMHTYPEIPQSAQFMLNLQNNEAESLTGIKAFSSRGITGNALGDSVGGIKSAMDAAAKREFGILRRLANGIKQIGRKIISMNAEFLSDVEVIRITNEEFVKVRRDDLPGNFDLILSISTPEADNEKASELAFMLQTIGQTMGPEFSQIILSDIARLRKMPDLAKRIEKYQPQPDPLIQEKAKLEIELLKARVQGEYAKAQENASLAELNKAKTSNTSSDTDMKDLNFVEQQTGTTQERALQKQGEQARSNIQLKMVENKLNQHKPN